MSMESKKIKTTIEEMNERLDLITATNPKHVILSNSRLAETLEVSTKTLSNWRNEGLIRYSKIGATIFYTLDNVLQFLENHVVDTIHEMKERSLKAA